MVFINYSGSGGLLFSEFFNNVAGSVFLGVLIIVMLITALFMLFGVPVEVVAILIMPLLLVCMAYTSEFLAIGGVGLIYLAVILVRMFFGRP